MVEAYWHIGKSIVEKQGGETRAEYGAGLIAGLSARMIADFGKGFTVANLKNMRQFYVTFPNGYALRSELSRSHYRLLMRVENEQARQFYLAMVMPEKSGPALPKPRGRRYACNGSDPQKNPPVARA
ncbi:MAG: hypothetical protein DELT_00487 [Desulfovibrio sp.]